MEKYALLRRFLTRKLIFCGTVALLISSTASAFVVTMGAGAATTYVSLSQPAPQTLINYQLAKHHDPNATVTVELALKPNDQAGLNSLMNNVYNPHSSQYHHWLPTGAFVARYKPTSAQMASVETFLKNAGLRVIVGSPSPFLLRVTGKSQQFEAAFHTTINDYRDHNGKVYFSNAGAIGVPANLSGIVDGVVGLDNLTRAHSGVESAPASSHAKPHFGGGIGGGLTPSQIAGIYLANPVYNLGDKGAGKTLGLFELSGYIAGDISTYCSQFSLTCPPLANINVDGGPTDTTGAIEVELDIELQMALAPGVTKIEVYQSPNTGQALIDQYAQIAADNTADSISTSWGLCEALSSPGIWDSEFTSFEQMAMQGQTIFAAAGDAGAFDCLHGGSSIGSNQVDDPASNPYMTSVGGTSLGSFDPGSNANPVYPTTGETVWNGGCTVANSCAGGAGGGGNSRIWAKPGYQSGPGVVSGYSKSSPWCTQPTGTACREVPDVSMNADPNTGYAEFCTDSTPNGCASIGWFQIGGTSAAAPLWAAIVALTDSHHNNRLGEASFALYSYDTTNGHTFQFHDVTSGDNGWFPARPSYDMATGIGTPKVFYLVTTLP